MTLVKLDKGVADKPAVHAFVIGVGSYPFLKGGTEEAVNTWNLGQLGSPPLSAMAFARWLATDLALPAVDGQPARPLGSIELLISQGKQAAKFTDPSNPAAGEVAVERATTEAVMEAFDGWFERASSTRDNLALFFFSGHGIEINQFQGLLLEGFNGSKVNPFRDIVELGALVNGMERCLARQQCFFADACRNTPEELRELAATGGVQLIAPSLDVDDVVREAAVICATAAHQSAFGVPGQPTRFTSALLRALRGAGADQVGDQWRVGAFGLVTHLTDLLTYESRTRMLPDQRARWTGGDSSGFTLHVPPKPLIPIAIACTSQADTAAATFSLKRGAEVQQRPADARPWELEVEVDAYDIVATFGDGRPQREKRVIVAPTLREVVL